MGMSFKDLKLKEYYISGVDNLIQQFYIPVLQKSVLYQRRTGYFNSRALAMAARGLTGLLKNNGKMQLICSVELDEPERAVLEDPVGYLQKRSLDVAKMLEEPYDEVERQRLALLAELLYRGTLEIKIAIPHSGGIYHEKAGIFYDSDDLKTTNIVAFNGSGNETPGGWLKNTESFHAYTSREDPRHIKPEVRTFESLWNQRLPGTTVIPLPEAIRRQLIKFRDYYREGLEEPLDPGTVDVAKWTWTAELAYVFEAPRLWNHADFAYSEVAITPYEHQDYVASSVLKTWPPRCMLCDEVGLGKTIEAGLVIRGYLAAGRADRILILAPKNILKQWQLQLLSKFNIMSWRLEGNFVYGPQPNPDVSPQREKVDAENPFRTKPILLVSSQLIRSQRRREQMLGLEYDLVVLDEAHHARARGASGRRQPNLLLEALEELKLQTQGLIFMTATPIQLSRKELWDLLMILELPGSWQDEEKFDSFFTKIDDSKPDWKFLFEMIQNSINAWGVNEDAIKELSGSYEKIDIHRIVQMIRDKRYQSVSDLNEVELEALKLILYRHTPVYRTIYRNSRELLRKYYEEGKYKERIPDRDTRPPDRIKLTGSSDDDRTEQGLYDKVDKYVRDFYAKYETIRKGLGFLMEVYRKRLTSSFYSIRKSLDRRAETVRTALESGNFGGLFREIEEEESELPEEIADEYARDIDEERFTGSRKEQDQMRKILNEELSFLNEFLLNLKDLHRDSKFEYLQSMLRDKMALGVRRVIVFSQFKDTVEFLLDQLRPHYGEKLGSYTGDGGSYWNGQEWKLCSKQKIQEKFADDSDELSILVCTDAASEGLDLQSCDTLINYDIPWNPMRIEQRIGRIDRIGQKSDKVTIHTLYYEDTVEEKVYSRCLERIGYFKSTLGHLQPILLETERFIRQAALARDRDETDEILKDIDSKLDQTVAQVNENKRILELLNHYAPRLKLEEMRTPVTQKQLEISLAIPLQSSDWQHEEEYWMKDGEVYTFEPKALDVKSRPASLLTPLSNLSLLFGNLPSIPETLEIERDRIVHCIDINGLTAFVTEINGKYHIVSKFSELSSPKGQTYSNLEECKQALVMNQKQRKKEQFETQLKAWENRRESWEVRAHMYLDKLLRWKWRDDLARGLEDFDQDNLLESWKSYIEDHERKQLKEIIRVSGFRADPGIVSPRVRGRPSKTSPRSAKKEERLLKERTLIQDRILNLREQLSTILT